MLHVTNGAYLFDRKECVVVRRPKADRGSLSQWKNTPCNWMCNKCGLFLTLSLVCGLMRVCLPVLIQLVQSDTQDFALFDVFLACGMIR
jgi:hypothetical protein